MLKENLFLVRVGGEWLLDLHVKLFAISIFRGFKTYLHVVDSDKKNLDEIRPVPTMYSSKRTPRARPPSLLYTSLESMKFIKEHDKDATDSFDKEKPRQTRASSARSNAKRSVSEKRKAPLQKEPPKKRVNLRECVREPESQDQMQLEDGDFSPTPEPGELGRKDRALPIIDGRSGFICAKCGLKYNDPLDPLPEETKWVFCPVCEVAIHTTCIAAGCICKYKPLRKHIN